MTAIASTHPTVSRFAIADGMLHIGGLPVGLLAERAGGTPFFAYERTGLTRRVEELRRALPDDIDLSYAVKANPMPAVGQHFRQVDGFDVASAGEMAIALDTPIPADRVSFAGPGKTGCLPPACRDRRPCGGLSGRRLRNEGQSHSVPRPCETDGAAGVDRRLPGLRDRRGEAI